MINALHFSPYLPHAPHSSLIAGFIVCNQFQLFLLKKISDQAAGWAEHESRRIRLERIVLYCPLVILYMMNLRAS
jgi:hypothetical protein